MTMVNRTVGGKVVHGILLLAAAFPAFVREHQSWLPYLCDADGGHAWCDNKLWDRVFYRLVELEVLFSRKDLSWHSFRSRGRIHELTTGIQNAFLTLPIATSCLFGCFS